ncbi:MAG: MFS transporter [Acidobacteria bacterium]|nr:MFS transporter [Acidobacteriota bacterium]
MAILQNSKPPLPGSNYKWVLLALLSVSGFLNLEDRVVIFSIIPLMRRDLHLSDLETGALMTAFLWVYAVFSPFAGYFGDRLSRRRVLIFSVCAWSVATMLAGLVTSTHQLFVTRFLLGFTESFYLPAALALMADWHTRATRGRAYAILSLAMGLGPILGGSFAGYVGEHFGWRHVLYVLGGIGVVHSLILYNWLRDAPVGGVEQQPEVRQIQKRPFGKVLKTLLSTPSLLCLGLMSGLNAVAGFMMNTWLPVYLYDRFHISLTQSAFLGNAVLMAPAMIGVAVGGILSDTLGRRNPKYRYLLFAVFMTLAIPWPLLFWWSGSFTVVLIAVALFMLCRSLGECNWHPVMYELVPPEMRGTATGVSNSFNCFMGGVGALAGGYYKSTLGLQAIFGLVAVLVAIGAAVLFWAYRVFLPRDLRRAQILFQENIPSSVSPVIGRAH